MTAVTETREREDDQTRDRHPRDPMRAVSEATGGGIATMRRGLRASSAFTQGIRVTLGCALIATAGRIVIPITIQQTLDHGINARGGADTHKVVFFVTLAAIAVLITAAAACLMNYRLYRSSESGLAELRVKAFRHVHDLSVLHQQTEQRGALVSRVTSDVDTITTFIQEGGLMLFVSLAQVFFATVVMAWYSWQLTLLVWVCFLPLFGLMRLIQRRTSQRYGAVRTGVGRMLGTIGESLVGAAVVRSYGIEQRTASRIGVSIDTTKRAQRRAQNMVVGTFSAGEVVAGLANAGIVVAGVELGVGGHLSAGDIVAMLFLVSLFITPVQWGVEMLNEAQNAIAGWRRVLGLLDAEPDVSDPGAAGTGLPEGPLGLGFERVGFAYPGGEQVLHGIEVAIEPRTRVAVVGETGSGKTTFAKLATRLMDPTQGAVTLGGVRLDTVPFEQLRRRVVMVPQDGFLFDATIAENVRYGLPSATGDDVRRAFADLGLAGWLDALPLGLATPVGQRGESLSAGERQLVALARAYIADPDLLVLDEATSAVDPVTEVRIQQALEGLTRGRTSIFIAHRLSTAEAADEVLVFDAGRVVERGPHTALADAGGVYSRLYASWVRQ